MRAITKWLVRGVTAAAKRNAVSNLISTAICADHLDPTTHPKWPTDALGGILHQPNGWLEVRLDRGATRLRQRTLAGAQPTAGTITGLLFNQVGSRGPVALLNQVPDLALRVAKTSKRAQCHHVVEHQDRAFNVLGLNIVRFTARRFRAIEAEALVRAVAKWFGG